MKKHDWLSKYLWSIGRTLEGLDLAAEMAYRSGDAHGLALALKSLTGLAMDFQKFVAHATPHENPPSLPTTVEHWEAYVDHAIALYHTLTRWARRAEGRVRRHQLLSMKAVARKQEETAILQARAMRAAFLKNWPDKWERPMFDKFRGWAKRRMPS